MHKTAYLSSPKDSTVDANFRKVQILFRTLAAGLAVLHVYAAIKSQSMNADGISYLDIGDAYFRADWVNAINPVWSPLYSWILGFVNFMIRPTMAWEFPVIHTINLLIYIGALASFEFMWRTVRTYRLPAGEANTLEMPEWLWWTLGYLLFIWISLSLIEIWSVTPDMLMAALIFLAAGLIAQIRGGFGGARTFLLLGLVLGLGYLSKTFMFSMALAFLCVSIIVAPRRTRMFSNIFLATGVFLLISLPFILLISEKKGKLTIGEAGTVTYVRYVNGMPFPHWQGDPYKGIALIHPSRVVHRSPTVYEFGEPIGGTYPISTDPSFWYEGIEPQFDPESLISRLFASGLVYAELFFQKQGILLACVLTLYVMGQRRRYRTSEVLRRWALMIPAVFAFGLYATVLVQDRYIGVFILLFWADILVNIQLPATDPNRSWFTSLTLIASIGLMANIAIFNLDGFSRLNQLPETGFVEPSTSPAQPLATAQTLKQLGLKSGDKVGVIGYAYDSFWARLARVKIVSEMLEADAPEFWQGNHALQQNVLQAFAGTGAKAVIAEYVPDDARLKDWHRVGDSNYYIYVFGE